MKNHTAMEMDPIAFLGMIIILSISTVKDSFADNYEQVKNLCYPTLPPLDKEKGGAKSMMAAVEMVKTKVPILEAELEQTTDKEQQIEVVEKLCILTDIIQNMQGSIKQYRFLVLFGSDLTNK